jgi:hypothetical protein
MAAKSPAGEADQSIRQLRVDFLLGNLFRCACVDARRHERWKSAQQEARPMRAVILLYLVVGIVLLAVGFGATGACPNKNTDVVSDVVFALTWPVGLYGYVIAGPLSPEEWLHKQACEGGLGQHAVDLPKPVQQ